VTCAPARTGAAAETVSFRGTVGVPPDRRALVASAVVGRIAEVLVHEGDHVEFEVKPSERGSEAAHVVKV